MYSFTIRCIRINAPPSRESVASALILLTMLGVTGTPAAADTNPDKASFAERCRAPSVVLCVPLDSEAEIARLRTVPRHLDAKTRIQLDPVERAARFTVPPRSPADTSGSLYIRFPKPMVDVFFAFDVRYPADFLRYRFKSDGWKIFILGQGPEGCAPYAVVGVNGYYRRYPSFYYMCGIFAGVEVFNPYKDDANEYDFQPGRDTQCLRSGRQRGLPCAFFVPDQWVTYQVRVNALARSLEVWQTVNGQTLNIINYHLDRLPTDGVSYEWLQLTPYSTGKDASEVHSTFHLWYRRVIVSTKKIPAPTAE